MAYGYRPSGPVELFYSRAGFYQELIKAAESQGFTREEALEILKIDALRSIASEIRDR